MGSIGAADTSENLARLSELRDHPIFTEPQMQTAASTSNTTSHSYSTLQRKICTRGSDLVVAVGTEVRMMPLSKTRSTGESTLAYKRLALPNVVFTIQQICLNPNGKLLAVCGTYDIVVLALPREGYSNIPGDTVDCRYVQVGQYYHGASSPPVAKLDWHPWGEAGSTLLVLTVDGILREYDTSLNPEVPQKEHHFLRQKSYTSSFSARRDTATSFTLGRGLADWGPLTVYVLTAGGDVYCACPYLPKNAVVPVSYLEGLMEYVEENPNCFADTGQSQAQDEQRQYLRQMLKHPKPHSLNTLQHDLGLQAVNIKSNRSPERTSLIQGPFRLQPAPHELEDTDGGDATDIIYLGFGDKQSGILEDAGFGVIAIAYQDGKVDVCIDIEKVEGKWGDASNRDSDTATHELPFLMVYETLDIGRGSDLERSTKENHPVLVIDPVLSCILYVYHAHGIHSISLVNSVWPLGRATSKGDIAVIEAALSRRMHSEVRELVSTFCQSRCQTYPIVGLVFGDGLDAGRCLLALSSKPVCIAITIDRKLAQNTLEAAPVPDSTLLKSRRSRHHSQTALSETSVPHEELGSRLSLLSLEPYSPPKCSATGIKPPSDVPRDVLRKPLEVINPETLQQFARASDEAQKRGTDLIVQLTSLVARIQLQEAEQTRQIGEEQRLIELFALLRERMDSQKETLLRATMTCGNLNQRAASLKTKLLAKSSPELSLAEQRWFFELAKVRQDSGYDTWTESSLKSRCARLSNDVRSLQDALKVVDAGKHKDIKSTFTYTPVRPTAWGTDQIKRYVNRLSYLQKEIQILQTRAVGLASVNTNTSSTHYKHGAQNIERKAL